MKSSDFKIDFIGIGTRRAGTTWIYHCLKEHPEICMSRVKETFVLHDFLETGEEVGPNAYAKYFRHCAPGTKKGEFTPHYLFDPATPRLIRDNFPNVKLMASFRDPVERLNSLYHFWKFRGRYAFSSFEEFLEKEDFGARQETCYATNLKRFLELFPREDLLCVIYEDIARDPLSFIQGIYAFLGVDSSFVPPSAAKRINLARDPRIGSLSRLSYRIVRGLERLPSGKKVLSKLMLPRLRAAYDSLMESDSVAAAPDRKPGALPPVKAETRAQLLAVYEDEIAELEQLLERSLNLWRVSGEQAEL